VHHSGIVRGEHQTLQWGFGEETAPEDLTGRLLTLTLFPGRPGEIVAPLQQVGGYAVFDVDSKPWGSYAPYLLRVDGVVRVGGTLSAGPRLAP
jgi:hypothetical protein